MNYDEKHLEAEIERELKSLPDLQAPRDLVPGVMAILRARKAAPWYHRAWSTWPPLAQAASLALLAGLFAALCCAAWHLAQAPMFLNLTQMAASPLSRLQPAWSALGAICGAIRVLAGLLQPWMLAAGAAAFGLSYVLCVGLGTFYVRLVMAQHRTS